MQPSPCGWSFSNPRLLTTAYALSCVAAETISEIAALSFEGSNNQPTAARQTERAIMATRRNQQLVNICGSTFPADFLQRLLADAAYDTPAIARAMGISTQVLVNALALPVPVPEQPINFTLVNGPCPWNYNICGVNFYGVAAIPFAHPWYPGYTWGTPVYINV